MNGDAMIHGVRIEASLDRRLIAGLYVLSPVWVVIAAFVGMMIAFVFTVALMQNMPDGAPEHAAFMNVAVHASFIAAGLGGLLCIITGAWMVTDRAADDTASRERVARLRASLLTAAGMLVAWLALSWFSGPWVMPLITVTVGLFALTLVLGVSLLAEHIELIDPRSPALIRPRRGSVMLFGPRFAMAAVILGTLVAFVLAVSRMGSGLEWQLLTFIPLLAGILVVLAVEDMLAQARGLRRRIELAREPNAQPI